MRLRRRLVRAAAGLGLLATFLVGFASGGGSVRAQEQQETAVVTRQAYFTRPATEPAPPVLFSGFPPGTVCLVAGLVGAPQLCGETVQDVADTLGLSDGLPLPVSPDSTVLQPVLPGTTPVGMLGGQERYASLLQFQLPVLAEDEELTSLELILHQDGLSFALESPAFRALVLAVILQAEDPNPDVITDTLARTVSGEIPAVTQSATGIEACPVVEGWNGGDAQDAAVDGTRLPDADCIRGTTGIFDPAEATWTFDLTFAAQAWSSGTGTGDQLTNEGIIFRPLGAPNVAYGDPDLSTNFLISLADGEAGDPALQPQIRYTTRSASTPVVAGTPGGSPTPAPVSGGAPSFTGPSPGTAGTPAVPATPGAPGPVGLRARWADRAVSAGAGDTPGWLLLLLPIGLGGAYLFGGSLVAQPDLARHRPGALSRLMEHRQAPLSTSTEPLA